MKKSYFNRDIMRNYQIRAYECYKRRNENPNKNINQYIWRVINVTKFFVTLQTMNEICRCKTKDFNKLYEKYYRE